MVVSHNLLAMNAERQLRAVTGKQNKSTEKLSSGYRINRAADDAAGLSISEKMRSQIKGLDKASVNASDGISVVQTAEGALNEVHAMLQRMNELATQAANDTNTSIDRSQLQLEINQLTSEIDRISSSTQFNTMNLLDGTFTEKNLQVGALCGQKIEISIEAMSAAGLGLAESTEITSIPGNKSITTVATNPALSVTVTDFSSITDTSLTWKKTVTNPASVIGQGGSSFSGRLTQEGALHYLGTNTDQRLMYLTAGTNYNTTSQITSDGWYDVRNAYNTQIYAPASIGTNAVASVTNVTSFIENLSGAPANKSVARVNLNGYSPNVQDLWSSASGNYLPTDLPTNFGISVSGTPTYGDTVSVSTSVGTDGTLITKKGTSLVVDSFEHAGDAMHRVQNAIDKVSTQRAKLGAIQNRLEHTISNLDVTSENTSASESRIRDTDMAAEMVRYSINNILAQAGQSMLAQANQSPQGVLSLLS